MLLIARKQADNRQETMDQPPQTPPPKYNDVQLPTASAFVMEYPASPPPGYDPYPAPVIVQPTDMAFPAVKPLPVSKQFQEHDGGMSASVRDTCTPVGIECRGTVYCLFIDFNL